MPSAQGCAGGGVIGDLEVGLAEAISAHGQQALVSTGLGQGPACVLDHAAELGIDDGCTWIQGHAPAVLAGNLQLHLSIAFLDPFDLLNDLGGVVDAACPFEAGQGRVDIAEGAGRLSGEEVIAVGGSGAGSEQGRIGAVSVGPGVARDRLLDPIADLIGGFTCVCRRAEQRQHEHP